MKTRSAVIAEVVAILGEAFRQKISPITIRAFELGIRELSIEAIEGAATRAICECKYMPSVSEFRELAGVNGVATVSITDRSAVAWAAVKNAVAKHGGYSSVQFDDPIVTATIRALGGWVRICDCDSGEKFDVWLKKDFDRTYAALFATGVSVEQVSPLPGLVDQTNSATGHVERATIVEVKTGLPPLPSHLIKGAPAKIIATEPVRRIAQQLSKSLGLPNHTARETR